MDRSAFSNMPSSSASMHQNSDPFNTSNEILMESIVNLGDEFSQLTLRSRNDTYSRHQYSRNVYVGDRNDATRATNSRYSPTFLQTTNSVTPSHVSQGTSFNKPISGATLQRFPSPNFSKVQPISYAGLEELLNKHPNEILLKICEKNSPFMSLIVQKCIRNYMMPLVLIVLGKVCTSNLRDILNDFLETIQKETTFTVSSVQQFLASLNPHTFSYNHLQSIPHLARFLQKLQNALPDSSFHFISLVLPVLRSKCGNFLYGHKFYSEVMEILNDIQENTTRIRNRYTSEMKKASKRRTLPFSEHHFNFRSLPVIPRIGDMHSEPFLRPNLVQGKYVDVEHYLDTQFRLLREDFVKPLRDGIADFLSLKQAGEPVKNCRNVRVYENVHIVKQDFVNGSIVHIAELTSRDISGIKWEQNKFFLAGSLLCLSSDGFKTVFFASVAHRKPEDLEMGKLMITFEDISEEILDICPLREFAIIETCAYFVAYRYNLKTLQELNDSMLPLKRYIVDVKTDVRHPRYLKTSTTYDIRPLLIPIDSKHIERIESIDGDVEFQYKFPSDVPNYWKFVHIMNDSSWPSAPNLNLDDSQYLAIKAALTKEFAIIQGPPGTGKTYVALRIVQLLLYNIEKWLMKEINTLPILVVCCTNHALDQFLEGMMCFTDKIVRIGGRSKSEAISELLLHKIRILKFQRGEIPHSMIESQLEQKDALKITKGEIDNAKSIIQKCFKIVLRDEELKEFIPDFHYRSLKNEANSFCGKLNLIDVDLIIHNWLNIPSKNDSEHVNEVTNESIYSDPLTYLESIEDYSLDDEDTEGIRLNEFIDNEDFDDLPFETKELHSEPFLSPDGSGSNISDGGKERSMFIKDRLNNAKPLDESEAMKISSVWSVDLDERWQLYKFWLDIMITKKQQECMDLQAQLKRQFEHLHQLKTEEDIFVLQSAHVVGMTTTGAAKYRDIVRRLNPQILIVEEAAQILESHTVTCLAPNTQHVILIGDHQQLRPCPAVHNLAVKYDMNISLFERMIRNKMDRFRLSTQHRMRPEITELIVPHIYKDLKNHESVTRYESIKGVNKNVFFISHDYNEQRESDSSSKVNNHEAEFLVKLCNYFIQQGYDSSRITVLTTYSAQLRLMEKLQNRNKVLKAVRFSVVDNYQGEENDIILISFVRSNKEREIGFIKFANRVCVALSRAKKGLFCIGDFKLFAEQSDLWKKIIETLKQREAIGQSLQLACQNHPNVFNGVASAKDFECVPDGGCIRDCEYRLSCGHPCTLKCHPYSRNHANILCHMKCVRTCTEGHECPKECFEDCGSCSTLVSVNVSNCGHTINVPCGSRNLEIICDAGCDEILSCGHKCPNKCGEPCAALCKEIVTVQCRNCDPEVIVAGCEQYRSDQSMKYCSNPCNEILDCGHKCCGDCVRCHQGRQHVACTKCCEGAAQVSE